MSQIYVDNDKITTVYGTKIHYRRQMYLFDVLEYIPNSVTTRCMTIS